MTDIPKWKIECGCWVDAFKYHKICSKHQKEFDEIHAIAVRDKALIEKWHEGLAVTDPAPGHSRHGTFEFLGGPITWQAYVAPKCIVEPVVQAGDLTSLM